MNLPLKINPSFKYQFNNQRSNKDFTNSQKDSQIHTPNLFLQLLINNLLLRYCSYFDLLIKLIINTNLNQELKTIILFDSLQNQSQIIINQFSFNLLTSFQKETVFPLDIQIKQLTKNIPK